MVSYHAKLHAAIVVCLGITLAMIILLSVSISALDIVRIDFSSFGPVLIVGGNGDTVNVPGPEIAFGIWRYCWYPVYGEGGCSVEGAGYSVKITPSFLNTATIILSSSWTRAFVLHPIASAFVLVTFLMALLQNTVSTAATLLSATFSLTMILVTLIVDIVLSVQLSQQFNLFPAISAIVIFDDGFWLMLVPVIFHITAFIIMCVAYYKDRRSKMLNDNYAMTSAVGSPTTKNAPTAWWTRFQWANSSAASSVTAIGLDRREESA